MAVLLPGKFLFLGTPRTGSSTVQQTLATIPGAKQFNQHIRRSTMIAENLGPYAGEHTFLAVRNPYDVLVSWWLRSRTGLALAEYVATYENKHFVNDGRLFWLVEDDMEVIRYETLQQNVDAVLGRLGIERRQLPLINVTRRKDPWESYYGPEEVQAVNDRFGAEIARYGYEVLDPASYPMAPPK